MPLVSPLMPVRQLHSFAKGMNVLQHTHVLNITTFYNCCFGSDLYLDTRQQNGQLADVPTRYACRTIMSIVSTLHSVHRTTLQFNVPSFLNQDYCNILATHIILCFLKYRYGLPTE